MLSIEALGAFVAIVDEGSFSAAAERLNQTPSGVSRTLSRLEKQLGVALIIRTTRRQELTEEGRLLLARARQILASLEETEAELSASLAQPAGPLRINAATPVLNHLIVPHIAGFMQAYPLIKLELIAAEAVIDLIEERVDVAIRAGALTDSTLNARLISENQLRLVASPAYLKKHGAPKSVADLRKHTLIGFSNVASLNLWPLNNGDSAGWPVEATLNASNGETIRHLVLNDTGIACLSEFLVREDVRHGDMQYVLEDQSLPWMQPIWAVFYKQGALAPRIACFVNYLAKAMAQ
ncbi:MAG TPA: LysR family transcriptional regulator [Rhodocyclaceae bacterium]|nr:LysR family transcriptional regulator [Rhodocyclaceae bacterium]